MEKIIKTLFTKERYQTIAVILTACLLLYFYACVPKTTSILNPPQKISREQLNIEVDILIAKANAGYASLEQQEKLRDLLFEQALIAAATGTINPIALLTTIGTILGIGAAADNVNKRKEIKKLTTK